MTVIFWIVFSLIIGSMMLLDLGVFSKKSHAVHFKEAAIWSGVWVGLALLFNLGIYWQLGTEQALLFSTGYLVELSLSVDNLFVFLVIFNYFAVPAKYRHKILFWGIIGAIFLRILFIGAGVALIHQFHWIIYVFGIFLIYTGIKLGMGSKTEDDPSRNIFIRFFRKVLPLQHTYAEGHFVIKEGGKWFASSMLIVLLVIESTDVVFALDSIPAILAITTDPFIVITSNIFAIVGLRALFFALAGFMEMFHYLNKGLAVILVFIGVKMLIADVYKLPTYWALAVIAVVLTASILASLIWPAPHQPSDPDLKAGTA